MTNKTKNLVTASIFSAIALFPILTFAQLPPMGGGSDGSTPAPEPIVLPIMGGGNDGSTLAPSTPSTPEVPASDVSSYSSSGSFIGGGSSFNSNVPIVSAGTTTLALSNNSCPLINTFMQIGANNDNSDVIKLQAFLKTTEQLDVDLSGIFDTKTDAAVKAFQEKYLSDTMGPWKASAPSGKVYITTKKKINEIACNTPLTLTTDELATINSYIQNQNSITTGPVGPSAPTTTPTIGENSNGSANTASVINAPIIQRVWNFIKGIFGR